MLEEMTMRIQGLPQRGAGAPMPRAGQGFTLIEMMTVIAILGILLALATPSFTAYFEKYRAKRAAETISAFLVNAKSEAIKRNAMVSTEFRVSGGGATWCLGMVAGTTCNCTAAGSCQIDGVDRVVSSADYKGVLLDDPDNGYAFQFDPVRGSLVGTGETVEVVSAGGQQIHVVVSKQGRIRMCSPAAAFMGGYAKCP